MILRFFYQIIINIVFHKSIRANNILECVRFVMEMKKAVLSMNKIMIYDVEIGWPSWGFLCIDYGLIFSASHRIQRYIIVVGGEKYILHDNEIVLPCNLKEADL